MAHTAATLRSMKQLYCVRGYRSAVAGMMGAMPLNEAMARSVGSDSIESFDRIGAAELSLLEELGFARGNALVDVGCGSVRLASQIVGRFGDSVCYVGTDVVPELLDFARERTPRPYSFLCVDACVIPAPDESADFVTLFSVFTHLRRREIHQYLREARRVLRPGGRIVFSYLSPLLHRGIFLRTAWRRGNIENHFATSGTIARWARTHRFSAPQLFPGRIGQSVAVLHKPIMAYR